MHYRLFSIPFIFFVLSLPATGQAEQTDVSAPISSRKQEIQNLITKLGDDDYIVRERAEVHLMRLGIEAFGELIEALNSPDPEIVRRAESVLSRIREVYQGEENENLRGTINLYDMEQNISRKARCIQQIANPFPIYGNPDGAGFRTLCRIARFDEEIALRAEATKALLAAPPAGTTIQRNWFRSLAQQFAEHGNDELFRLIYDFSRLRGDIDALKDATEQQVRRQAREQGVWVDYPVPLQPDQELTERLDRLRGSIDRFREKPEYRASDEQSWLDVLLLFALADFENTLGLDKQRDGTLETIDRIRIARKKLEPDDLPFDLFDGLSFNEHYYAGRYLFENNRLLWGERQLQIALETEDNLLLRQVICNSLSNLYHLIGDLDKGIEVLDTMLEVLDSEEYKKQYPGARQETQRETEARRFCFLGQQAASKNDWVKAKEYVDKAIECDPGEIDSLILRYEVGKNVKDLDENYRNRLKHLIESAIGKVEQQLNSAFYPPQIICNQVAWLLANTGGDYPTAKALIDVTIKLEPESPMYLDTQAHVFMLGKEYQKAVETQEEAVRLVPESGVFRQALKRFREQLKAGN